MNTHSPIPWFVHGDNNTLIASEDGKCMVGEAFRSDGGAHRKSVSRPLAEAQANADFVVRAVNAHDDLLANLVELNQLIRSFVSGHLVTWPVSACQHADAAIERATA